MAVFRYADPTEITDYDVFIDGLFEPSTGDERVHLTYPYDGCTWASVPDATSADVDAAMAAAETAYTDEWGQTLPSERRTVLHDIADVIETHAAELAELETLQNGRTYDDQRHIVDAMADFYRYYAGYCDKVTGTVHPIENNDGTVVNYTRVEPYGIVGLITTWNAPLFMTARKLAAALAAGNTVVHKPSEHAPVSALRFAELIYDETTLPAGVYNIITGAEETGVTLTTHDAVGTVSFTGSTAVGRAVGRNAGAALTPVTLQLGANNPTVVFSDTPLEGAVDRAVKAAFTGNGQGCTAGARVLVQDEIFDAFLDRFTAQAARITLGDPMDPETDMGPLAYEEHYETVIEYIESGLDAGAQLELGGPQADVPGDLFIAPTVLSDADMDMRVAREEVFGPVVTLHSFRDDDEAVRIANDTEYGLVASVWTENLERAHTVANRLETGSVFVNGSRQISYNSPFGGYKNSGLGREHAEHGIRDFLQVKSVWIDLSDEDANPFRVGTQ